MSSARSTKPPQCSCWAQSHKRWASHTAVTLLVKYRRPTTPPRHGCSSRSSPSSPSWPETHPSCSSFEDLHWADSASAELLGYLVRNLTDTQALLLVTYRAEELMRDHPLHGWLTELTRHPRTTQLKLSGLDRSETAHLIGGILGQQPTWALVDAVWARSQGNPFFAEELTAARDDPSLSPELQGVSSVESKRSHSQHNRCCGS